jgi:putative nucleotidyltransferase with HDIG domain
MAVHISCITSAITSLLFLSLFYLFVRNHQNKNLLYVSLPFLAGSVALFSHFQIELAHFAATIIFWTKFKYLGVFSFIHFFPSFASVITKEKISSTIKYALGSLTLFYFLLTIFTDLIISSHTFYYANLLSADRGILYLPLMVIFLAVTVYYCIRILVASRQAQNRQINYTPILVGLGFGHLTGFIDLVSYSLRNPIIPAVPNTFVYGVFGLSITAAWTFLSQYSWILDTFTESEAKITKLIARSDKTLVEFIQLVAKTLEAKDHYTAGHSLRVMDYAVKIAEKLNLSINEIELLKHACLLHDIGKIGIPDGILNKKSPLNEKDRTHIINHPVLGKQILSMVGEFQNILDIVYLHHERMDGKGYPNGLTKDEIPLLARIITVADAYDAMLSERPYRKANTKEQTLEELKKCSGTQFDPKIVGVFTAVLEEMG